MSWRYNAQHGNTVNNIVLILKGERRQLNLLCYFNFKTLFLFSLFNDVLLIMLLQLSQFLPLCPPLPSIPLSLRQSPHHCSCPWLMHRFSGYSISYTVLCIPWLFCTYLFVLLNPLTSSPILCHTPPIWQPSKRSLYLCFCLCSSCLLSLLFRFNC